MRRRSTLTKERERILRNYQDNLREKYTHTGRLSFHNRTARLRFVNRIMPTANLSSIENQTTQDSLARAYINYYVALNKLIVNTSVKLAKLTLIYSEGGLGHVNALRMLNVEFDSNNEFWGSSNHSEEENSHSTEEEGSAEPTKKELAEQYLLEFLNGLGVDLYSHNVVNLLNWANEKASLGLSIATDVLGTRKNDLTLEMYNSLSSEFLTLRSSAFTKIRNNYNEFFQQHSVNISNEVKDSLLNQPYRVRSIGDDFSITNKYWSANRKIRLAGGLGDSFTANLTSLGLSESDSKDLTFRIFYYFILSTGNFMAGGAD